MYIVLIACFILASLLHLAACFADWKPVCLLTKPLLMPLLLGCYLLSADPPSPAVICALVFGFLGDAAMMVPRPDGSAVKPQPALLVGLGTFFLGHVSYLTAFIWSAALWPPVWVSLLAAVLGLGLFMLVFLSLRPYMGSMMLPGTAYLIILVTMVCVAVITGIALPSPLRVLGGFFFLLSDYILARSILLREHRLTHFYVMLTYLLAQSLLIISLL